MLITFSWLSTYLSTLCHYSHRDSKKSEVPVRTLAFAVNCHEKPAVRTKHCSNTSTSTTSSTISSYLTTVWHINFLLSQSCLSFMCSCSSIQLLYDQFVFIVTASSYNIIVRAIVCSTLPSYKKCHVFFISSSACSSFRLYKQLND